MPQFETTYLVSQLFWLLVSFGGLYLGVRFVVFPLFNTIFNKRQNELDIRLNQAETLTQQAQILEEQMNQKHQRRAEHLSNQISMAHEKGQVDFQTAIEQNEQHLMKLFQNQIQKMERDEKTVLKNTDIFIAKAKKGSL